MSSASSSAGLIFTVKLDASDLKRLVGVANASGTGGGGGGANRRPRNNNAGLLKNLLFLEAINKSVGGILSQSKIFTTYQSAMGKIFGAVLDTLLIPFTPLLNLMIMGMNKLLVWLIQSGTLDWLKDVMQRVADNITASWEYIKPILKDVRDVLRDFKNGAAWAKLGKDIWNAIQAGMEGAMGDKAAAIAEVILAVGGVSLALKGLGTIFSPLISILGILAGRGGGGGGTPGGGFSFFNPTTLAIAAVAAVNYKFVDEVNDKVRDTSPPPKKQSWQSKGVGFFMKPVEPFVSEQSWADLVGTESRAEREKRKTGGSLQPSTHYYSNLFADLKGRAGQMSGGRAETAAQITNSGNQMTVNQYIYNGSDNTAQAAINDLESKLGFQISSRTSSAGGLPPPTAPWKWH